MIFRETLSGCIASVACVRLPGAAADSIALSFRFAKVRTFYGD
jgi:hypothetical protein